MMETDIYENPDCLKPAPLNPWQRLRNYDDPFDCRMIKYFVNSRKKKFITSDLDHNTKNAVLKVSPSVVGLASYSGGEQVFWGSGVIFESSPKKNGSFYYLVLTSATLLRPPRSDACDNRTLRERTVNKRYVIKPAEDEGFVLIDETIDVYILGFGLHKGTVVTSDFHFNIAVLKFKSDYQLPAAVLRPLDDSFNFLTPINSNGCTSKFDSRLRLIPGDKVIAVGRYTENPFEIMTAPGKYRCSRRPWMGMEVANHFYTSKLGLCERLLNLGISQGVRVKQVSPRSPAKVAGLRPGDVIIKCHGKTVTSPLQFFELIWEMAGKVVKATVVRKGSFQNVNIKIKDITSANGFYQWRLPREYVVHP